MAKASFLARSSSHGDGSFVKQVKSMKWAGVFNSCRRLIEDTEKERSCFRHGRYEGRKPCNLTQRRPIILKSLCAWKSVWVGGGVYGPVYACLGPNVICACVTRDGPDPTIWWLTHDIRQCGIFNSNFNHAQIHEGGNVIHTSRHSLHEKL